GTSAQAEICCPLWQERAAKPATALAVRYSALPRGCTGAMAPLNWFFHFAQGCHCQPSSESSSGFLGSLLFLPGQWFGGSFTALCRSLMEPFPFPASSNQSWWIATAGVYRTSGLPRRKTSPRRKDTPWHRTGCGKWICCGGWREGSSRRFWERGRCKLIRTFERWDLAEWRRERLQLLSQSRARFSKLMHGA